MRARVRVRIHVRVHVRVRLCAFVCVCAICAHSMKSNMVSEGLGFRV